MKQQNKFKQTEIGIIPEEWEEVILSEVVEINPKRELKRGAKSKFVSMGDIQPFTRKISNFIIKEFKGGGSKFKNGDTLFARITPCLENGKTAFVNILDEEEVGFGSTEFIVVSAKENKTNPSFVYYLLRSPEVRSIAIKSMTGTSGRQRVENDVFDSIIINLPPLPEQRAIAKILSDLDAKIELNQQMNKTLEAIGQAIFKHWFVDFEFPNEEGKPYKSSGGEMVYNEELGKEIPKGWKVKPIDEIADFLNGLPLQKFPPESENEFLPVIKIRELRQGITDTSDKASLNIPKEYIVNDGDVLFSWSGSLEVVVWTFGEGALNQHLFKVTSKDYSKWFYYYWIIHYLPEYRRIAEGKATTMGHIQRHHLKSSLVLVPDANTLERMNRILNPIIEKIIKINIESRILSSIRDSLLPKLMSGKIRVPVEAFNNR
jgi:type I restriction enzyme S subunit